MNINTRTIYLWIANDHGLYDMVTDLDDPRQLRDAFLEYIRPIDQSTIMQGILEDLISDVDWGLIWERIVD